MNKNNQEFQKYETAVNHQFKEIFGLTYEEIRKDLHVDNLETLRNYWESGVAPKTASLQIGDNSGFLKVEDYGQEYVSVYNRMQSALLNYQKDSDFMIRNEAGVLIMEKLDGEIAYHFTIKPELSRDNNWGIRVKEETIPLDRVNATEYSHIEYNGKDISDVVKWFQDNVLKVQNENILEVEEPAYSAPALKCNI